MAVAFTQVGFRGRNDDGAQTTATWKAATNTSWTQDIDVNFRVRFDSSETGTTASTLTPQLQYQLNGGTATAVTASSTVVRSFSSGQIADGTATTQIISAGTFVAGSTDTVDGLCAVTGSIAQNVHTEHEFCVQIRSAAVAHGDTVSLRLVRSPSTAYGTYTASPSITVNKPFTGTGTGSISVPTASGAGALVFTGTGAGTSTAPAGVGAGTYTAPGGGTFTGTGTGAVAAPTASVFGRLEFPGTGSGSTVGPTASGSGAEIFSGASAGTVAAPSAAVAGVLGFTGAASGAVRAVTATAAGLEIFVGAGTGVIGAPAAYGTGTVPVPYAGAVIPISAVYLPAVPISGVFCAPMPIQAIYLEAIPIQGAYVDQIRIAGQYSTRIAIQGVLDATV